MRAQTISLSILALLWLTLAACSGPANTILEVELRYEEAWNLDSVIVSGGTNSTTLEPQSTIRIILPDEDVGMPIDLQVEGFVGGAMMARGTVSVTPELGRTVDALVILKLVKCDNNGCTEGDSMCVIGGLSSCVSDAMSGCMVWSEPVDCEHCIEGECTAACAEADCTTPPGDTCVNEETLRMYSASGTCSDDTCAYEESFQNCGALGCCVDACCDLDPSNGEDTGPLQATGLQPSVSGGEFHTDDDCDAVTIIGTCEKVDTSAGANLCVCRVDSLTIESGDFQIFGSRALVILALNTVSIAGDVQLHGSYDLPGPGSLRGFASSAPGNSGGTGGTYGTVGGDIPTFGNPENIPLEGGMSGRRGCSSAADGGGGGGALQITAGESIEILGSVNAGGGGGGGGDGGCNGSGGGGGGSGGALLFEAPLVSVSGIVAANGGGGGGGGANNGHGSGFWGSNGRSSLLSAGGGLGQDDHGCPVGGYTSGGWGGNGSNQFSNGGSGGAWDSVSNCIGSPVYVGGGGHGGQPGRIRINTVSGCNCTGTISPPVSTGTISGS